MDFIQTIDVKGQVFLVFDHLSGGEHDWDLQNIFLNSFNHSFLIFHLNNFIRKDNFSFRDFYIQEISLLEKRLNCHCCVLSVPDFKVSGDWKGLLQYKARSKVIIEK